MARLGTFALLATLVVPLSHIQAGVYSPGEPTPFSVRADGTAEEMPFGPEFEGQFAVRFGQRLNEADDRPGAVRGSENKDRRSCWSKSTLSGASRARSRHCRPFTSGLATRPRR